MNKVNIWYFHSSHSSYSVYNRILSSLAIRVCGLDFKNYLENMLYQNVHIIEFVSYN